MVCGRPARPYRDGYYHPCRSRACAWLKELAFRRAGQWNGKGFWIEAPRRYCAIFRRKRGGFAAADPGRLCRVLK